MGQSKKELAKTAKKLGVDPELPYNQLRTAIKEAKAKAAEPAPEPEAPVEEVPPADPEPEPAPEPEEAPAAPTMTHSDWVPPGGASMRTATTKRDWIPGKDERKAASYFPCQLCNYEAESERKLAAHVKKIHD